jgi:hypothetical protein
LVSRPIIKTKEEPSAFGLLDDAAWPFSRFDSGPATPESTINQKPNEIDRHQAIEG